MNNGLRTDQDLTRALSHCFGKDFHLRKLLIVILIHKKALPLVARACSSLNLERSEENEKPVGNSV
jgi:hypothetical protein